jgi:hypothetical protein
VIYADLKTLNVCSHLGLCERAIDELLKRWLPYTRVMFLEELVEQFTLGYRVITMVMLEHKQ